MSDLSIIPSFGFTRGAIVREVVNGPNMLVVRGLGATTVVIVIEDDASGSVRLRERPTNSLHQVLAPGDYAEHIRSPTDWEPDPSHPDARGEIIPPGGNRAE